MEYLVCKSLWKLEYELFCTSTYRYIYCISLFIYLMRGEDRRAPWVRVDAVRIRVRLRSSAAIFEVARVNSRVVTHHAPGDSYPADFTLCKA
jgi:hypothetical protein